MSQCVAQKNASWGFAQDEGQPSIIILPIEVMGFTLSFLEGEDLENTAKVCRAFRNLLGGGFYFRQWTEEATSLRKFQLCRVITAQPQEHVVLSGCVSHVKKRVLYYLHNLPRVILNSSMVEDKQCEGEQQNLEAHTIFESVCSELARGTSHAEICSLGSHDHEGTAISAYLSLVDRNITEAEKLIFLAREQYIAQNGVDSSFQTKQQSLWQKIATEIARSKLQENDVKGAKDFVIEIYRRELNEPNRPAWNQGSADFIDLNAVLLEIIARLIDQQEVKEAQEAIADIGGHWKSEALHMIIERMSVLHQFEKAFELFDPYICNGIIENPEMEEAFRVFFYEYLNQEYEEGENSITELKVQILGLALDQLKEINGSLIIKKMKQSKLAIENFCHDALTMAKISLFRQESRCLSFFCLAARIAQLGEMTPAKEAFEAALKIQQTNPLDNHDESAAAWFQAEYYLACGDVPQAITALEKFEPENGIEQQQMNMQELLQGLDRLPPSLEKIAIIVSKMRDPVPQVPHWSTYPMITITDSQT